MAVIRLTGRKLFVWSPILLESSLKSEMETLGDVAFLVSPNKLHHLYLTQWQHAFPAASLWAPPGLARKRRDLSFREILDGNTPWRNEIDQLAFTGSLVLTEIVFFHRLSRTALFGDLIQNFRPDWFTGWRGWIARLDGITAPDPGAPREWRASFVHRTAARRALARLLSWRPSKVIIAHGTMPRRNATAFVRRSLRWL
jgi:hypothetical protein